MIFGSKQKLRCNREEIPYIFAKFQNFLNFRVRDLPLLVAWKKQLRDSRGKQCSCWPPKPEVHISFELLYLILLASRTQLELIAGNDSNS